MDNHFGLRVLFKISHSLFDKVSLHVCRTHVLCLSFVEVAEYTDLVFIAWLHKG